MCYTLADYGNELCYSNGDIYSAFYGHALGSTSDKVFRAASNVCAKCTHRVIQNWCETPVRKVSSYNILLWG